MMGLERLGGFVPKMPRSNDLKDKAWDIVEEERQGSDPVEHPPHYNWFDIECMDVAQHFSFHMGNAIKYIWRAGYKGDALEDIDKAIYSLKMERERRERL